MDMPNLEFRKIESLYFLYEVSEDGRILRNAKSKKRLTIRVDYHHAQKGYAFTWICLKGKVKRVPIARVVAECWLGAKPEGYQIDHIDRDTLNNHYTNLRYVTVSEQMKNRDYTRISAQGTRNCQAYVETIKKPVTVVGAKSVCFESIAACARWLAQEYGKPFEHMRAKLKQRRARVYDYDLIYGMQRLDTAAL